MADLVPPVFQTLSPQDIAARAKQANQQRAQQLERLQDNAASISQRRGGAERATTPPPQENRGPSPAQVQRQEDQRYDQVLTRRVDARQDTQADITLQQDRQLDAARAAETRTRDALDQARGLDTQQYQRAQQLEQDLQRLEQQRQDAIDASRQSGEPVQRGQVLDVIA